MKTIIIITIAAVVCVAAYPEVENRPSPRIVGGKEAIPHSLPYQAFLSVVGTSTIWKCGGAVISHYYILSSGRCVDGAVQIQVTLGAHNISGTEPDQITYITTNILKHPDFNDGSHGYLANDIALVKTEYEIPFNNHIQPIGLPTLDDISDSESFYGRVARASGWGLTDGYDEIESEVLRYFDAKIIKNTECTKDGYGHIYNTNICTSGVGNGTICTGDVGGPLVADFKLVGINSAFFIACLKGYPSTYTRVSSYLDWIAENSDVVIT